MKILIAEADAAVSRSIEATLRRAGHQTVLVRDGAAVKASLDRDDIRFVIADTQFEGGSGLDICSAVRRNSQAPYVYLILLVDHFGSQEVIDGIFAGADDFLAMPLVESELADRVRYGQRILSLNCRESIALVLSRMAEMKDSFMGQHLERVQHYSVCLAEALREDSRLKSQLEPDYIRQLFRTCALHDIGKFCIPDSILLKPGRLSADEFRIVQTHPLAGAGMLDLISRFFPDEHLPRMARDIVVAHHEQWNGQGYPRGLAGDEIPLAARIVKLADMYDALTSQRVYREAMSHATARDIIAAESGKQLDPATVAAFCRVEPKFMRIRWRFSGHPSAALSCAV